MKIGLRINGRVAAKSAVSLAAMSVASLGIAVVLAGSAPLPRFAPPDSAIIEAARRALPPRLSDF